MKFTKGNHKKNFNIKKAAESWNFGSVSAYKDAQQSGQLALYVCKDMEKRREK